MDVSNALRVPGFLLASVPLARAVSLGVKHASAYPGIPGLGSVQHD